MSDEFDDAFEGQILRRGVLPERTLRRPTRPRVARLVSRLYGAAGAPLRARLLECLVRPLGALGLMAVASGAFGRLLHRASEGHAGIPLDDVERYSNDQTFELVRFVEQVSPEAIQQIAALLADSPVSVAAFSAAATMLLVRVVGGVDPNVARTVPPTARESLMVHEVDDVP